MKVLSSKSILLISFVVLSIISGCKSEKDEPIPDPLKSTKEFLQVNGENISIDSVFHKKITVTGRRHFLSVSLYPSRELVFRHTEEAYSEGIYTPGSNLTDSSVTMGYYNLDPDRKDDHQFETNAKYASSPSGHYEMFRSGDVYISEFNNIELMCYQHGRPGDSSVRVSGRIIWKYKDN